MTDSEYSKLFDSLQDWLNLTFDDYNTSSLSAILIAIGSKIAFDGAPTIEDAKIHIEKILQAALIESSKAKKVRNGNI